MVSEGRNRYFCITRMAVLILVLVEDGLGAAAVAAEYKARDGVLILVLVEDGLGETLKGRHITWLSPVLILVLVEDGLGEPPRKLGELW